MSRQVRISDDLADWLSGQGGSLSAAAERTLLWAREAIDAVDNGVYVEDEPVDSYLPPPSEHPAPPAARPADSDIRTRTSTRSARHASFSPIIRRW